MKWHKLSPDCKPDEGKHVLLSCVCFGKRSPDACCIAILGEDNDGDAVWNIGSQWYPIEESDRWAYIELPED